MSNKINIPEYEVSEFNRSFKEIIETNFNYIRIKGEISEIKTATKGQIYLTLKDQDSISEYHKAWWKDVIRQKAENLNYNISEDMLDTLMNRWSFNIKTPRIDQLAKMIDNEEFVEWMRAFDKKDFKQYQKQNVQPFESIFLKLGAEIMKNASNFLAANPTKAVQDIRKDIAQVIRDLRSTNDISKVG